MCFKCHVKKELRSIKKDLVNIEKNLATLGDFLIIINSKIDKMSKTNDQVLAVISEMNDETNVIASRIDAYVSQLETTVAPETVAGLKSISQRLKLLASDPAQPVPAPAPEETPALPTENPSTPVETVPATPAEGTPETAPDSSTDAPPTDAPATDTGTELPA